MTSDGEGDVTRWWLDWQWMKEGRDRYGNPGRYVEYDDHARIVAEKDAEIAWLRETMESVAFEAENNPACGHDGATRMLRDALDADTLRE